MAFMDLEKTFGSVPQKVIWWVLRKICVDEWIVQLVRGMYADEPHLCWWGLQPGV